MNRLERCGTEYHLAESFKKVALKQILVGRLRNNDDLWNSDKLQVDELLRRVRDQSRAKKLDNRVAKGKAGVTVGRQQIDGGQQPQGESIPQGSQQSGASEQSATDSMPSTKASLVRVRKERARARGTKKEKGKGTNRSSSLRAPPSPS